MFYLQNKLPNGYEFEFTFMFDFDIADHFGVEAVIDTYKRSFKSFKKDIVALTEIECVLNMRCWYWHYHNNDALSRVYEELYYKVRDYILGDENGSPFSSLELEFHFNTTD